MGQASNLFIKETRIKAMFLSSKPMLDDIKALDWDNFESVDNWSKLFGFHIGDGISTTQLFTHLEAVLKKRLHDARLNPYSILVRVVVANQMVVNTFWYYIQLCPGKFVDLKAIDKEIKAFI